MLLHPYLSLHLFDLLSDVNVRSLCYITTYCNSLCCCARECCYIPTYPCICLTSSLMSMYVVWFSEQQTLCFARSHSWLMSLWRLFIYFCYLILIIFTFSVILHIMVMDHILWLSHSTMNSKWGLSLSLDVSVLKRSNISFQFVFKHLGLGLLGHVAQCCTKKKSFENR